MKRRKTFLTSYPQWMTYRLQESLVVADRFMHLLIEVKQNSDDQFLVRMTRNLEDWRFIYGSVDDDR